jgi:hypothetical protein
MYDYARRYSPVIRGRQRVATRREGLASVGGRFWELAGSLMIGAIAVLLVSSIWCGWQIKSDQGALLLEKAQGRSLSTGHKQLVQQRDELASRERVEKMAAKILRLFPPAQDQIIRL